MTNFAAARVNMIEGQVRANDVTDSRIVDVMARLPRERFVPPAKRHLAYGDLCPDIGEGRYLLDARTLSKLLQVGELSADDRVLDIACGTGYSTAVLASICKEVVGLEESAAAAEEATRLMREFGAGRATIAKGTLTQGHGAGKPYDLILINGAVDEVPETIVGQLKEGGRLLCVVRQGPVGKAHFCVRRGGALSHRVVFDATVPVLPGFVRKESFAF